MNAVAKKDDQYAGYLPPPSFCEADIANTTPAMAQYMEAKLQHPDALVFYRMGDFYELFFEDAEVASKALDIALTKRGKHGDKEIAMCGVPHHAHESYLSKLIKKGYKVAICEQVETPAEAKERAKRDGGKAIVKREIVRIVTQGTLTEDNQLDTRRNNYLLCLSHDRNHIGATVIDISTGQLLVEESDIALLPSLVERYHPSEILLSDKLHDKQELTELWDYNKSILTIWPSTRFDSKNAQKRIKDLFSVGSLDGFGDFSNTMIASMGTLLDYVDLTQKGKIPHILPPKVVDKTQVMHIDAATRKNLEINRTLSGEKSGSLLACLDQTMTAAGARLFASRLNNPLTDKEQLNERLDQTEFFLNHGEQRETIRELLKQCPDIERCLSRVSADRCGPRDISAICTALLTVSRIKNALVKTDLVKSLQPILDCFTLPSEINQLSETINHALKDDLPLLARDGGFVREGFAPELDQLLRLRKDSRSLILELEAEYLKKSGASSLKIKSNNVIGYFIETPASQGDKLLNHDDRLFIHRQTMANSVRFTTVELSDLENKIASANDKALAMELQIFDQLCTQTKAQADKLSKIAQALAILDVASAVAELAILKNYTRPKLLNDQSFTIQSGRHPVVEDHLPPSQSFVPNNCAFDTNDRLWLLTGPNMAGKSTFLRQNAIIALMAQAGLYVPADKVEIGIIDRLFSRVGAADDLARGHSTFMVEMVETAAILNQATHKSFVILDEIGRGTSTFDGLSIAWSTVEHLHDVNQCRTLFATHYHELTTLENKLKALSCHTIKIKEWENKVVFMHEVINGAANQSYGVHVADLAGLPSAVIMRAKEILKRLEQDERSGKLADLSDNLPLFSQVVEAQEKQMAEAKNHPAIDSLSNIDPNNLSPKQALDLIYDLKSKLDD